MKKFVRIVTNKFFIVALAFLAWVGYFDQNDWLTLRQRQKELDGVKDNIAYLNSEISRMNAERNDLLTNNQKLEQYARENYRMKQDGEDVYVIEK